MAVCRGCRDGRARRADRDRGRGQRHRHACRRSPPGVAPGARDGLPARRTLDRQPRRPRHGGHARPPVRRLPRLLRPGHGAGRGPERDGTVRRGPVRRRLAGQRRAAGGRPGDHRRALRLPLALGPHRRGPDRGRGHRRGAHGCRPPAAAGRRTSGPPRPARVAHRAREVRDAARGTDVRRRSRRPAGRSSGTRRPTRSPAASSCRAATYRARRATRPGCGSTTPGATAGPPRTRRSTTSASSRPASAVGAPRSSPPARTRASSTSASRRDGSSRARRSTCCWVATTSPAPASSPASTRP